MYGPGQHQQQPYQQQQQQQPYYPRPPQPQQGYYPSVEDDGWSPAPHRPPPNAYQYQNGPPQPQYQQQPQPYAQPQPQREAWTPEDDKDKKKKKKGRKNEQVEYLKDEPRPDVIDKTRKRKCHDVFWLILFALVFGGMCAIGYYSFRYGNVSRLLYGRDSEGNLCGSRNGTDSARDLYLRPNLYYFDLSDANSTRICVVDCPSTTGDVDSVDSVVCPYDVTPGANAVERLWQVGNKTCGLAIASEGVLNRCVPQLILANIVAAANASYYNETYTATGNSNNWSRTLTTDFNARDVAQSIFQDLAASWWVISVCVAAAFVLSAVWLLLLQLFAGFIIYATLMIVLIAGWGLTAYFIYNYLRITVLHQGFLAVGFEPIDSALYNEKLLLILGCTVGGISLILSIIILCLLRRIRLAVRVIKEASRAMRAMPLIFFFPIFKYIIVAAWMVIFVGVMALLATSGDIIAARFENDINTGLREIGKQYSNSGTLQYMQIYFVFGFLWVYNWLVAIGQCTIAGAIAIWYWSRDKNALPSLPVIRSFGRTLRYHLGSLAFGSLVIAIVQLIRIIILEAQRRVKGSGNKTAQYILCCLQCCFKCVEKVLKMITKNAYVEIAVYGYSFCTAARKAMELILANAVRLVVVNKIGNFLIFIGKLAIVFITTLGGLGLFVWVEKKNEVLANYAVPLIFIFILTYITATAFLSTFSMAISTIFLSFCEDSQRNDGSRERPYYMSKDLQQFVDKHAHDKPMV
ncbi:plasma-membrane choline transporter-domain-containing protein [Phlyctochytrium arcticum]|nr:plasma-membrane choline transporter-domain-containing protein [Phlyctochytrium arcticum]